MALSISIIKSRLQTSFGSAQNATIQDAELTKLATALFNIFTLYPILSPVTALPGSATGNIVAPAGTFLTTLQTAFPPAQDVAIQTTELTKLANGIEVILNNDAQASYPLSPGGVVFPFTISGVTSSQALLELKNSFGPAQDNTLRDAVLTPMAQGITDGLLLCTGSISVSTGLNNITATGVIV